LIEELLEFEPVNASPIREGQPPPSSNVNLLDDMFASVKEYEPLLVSTEEFGSKWEKLPF